MEAKKSRPQLNRRLQQIVSLSFFSFFFFFIFFFFFLFFFFFFFFFDVTRLLISRALRVQRLEATSDWVPSIANLIVVMTRVLESPAGTWQRASPTTSRSARGKHRRQNPLANACCSLAALMFAVMLLSSARGTRALPGEKSMQQERRRLDEARKEEINRGRPQRKKLAQLALDLALDLFSPLSPLSLPLFPPRPLSRSLAFGPKRGYRKGCHRSSLDATNCTRHAFA